MDPLPLLNPTVVSGLSGVQAISCGDDTCDKVRQDGTVWAWGNSGTGEPGKLVIHWTATPVPVLGLTTIASIHAGQRSGTAVGKDGILWAWGTDTSCELGVPVVPPAAVPVQITR